MSFLVLQGNDKMSAAFPGFPERVAALLNCLIVKNKCFRLFVYMFPSIKIYDKNCIKYIAIVKIMIIKKKQKTKNEV